MTCKSCYGCKALSLNVKTREHACYYGIAIKNDSHKGDCIHPKTWKDLKKGIVDLHKKEAAPCREK